MLKTSTENPIRFRKSRSKVDSKAMGSPLRE